MYVCYINKTGGTLKIHIGAGISNENLVLALQKKIPHLLPLVGTCASHPERNWRGFLSGKNLAHLAPISRLGCRRQIFKGVNMVQFWHDEDLTTARMSACWKDLDGNVQRIDDQLLTV